MRVAYFFPLLALAACQTATTVLEPSVDPCGSYGFLSQVGLMAEAVPAGTFPESVRMIRPGTMVTQDYQSERLNVHINENGRIVRIDCG